MVSGSEISLVKPRLGLVHGIREALAESYADRIEYLFRPEPNPSIEQVRQNIEQAVYASLQLPSWTGR
jgi:hypothetical protein